jgi:hypothetical protein
VSGRLAGQSACQELRPSVTIFVTILLMVFFPPPPEFCTSEIQDCRYETCSMCKEASVVETEA